MFQKISKATSAVYVDMPFEMHCISHQMNTRKQFNKISENTQKKY